MKNKHGRKFGTFFTMLQLQPNASRYVGIESNVIARPSFAHGKKVGKGLGRSKIDICLST